MSTPAALRALSSVPPSAVRVTPAVAAAALAQRDPMVARLLASYGVPKFPRSSQTPSASLVVSITHQQIATAAARPISARLETLLGVVTAQRVLAVAPDELRAVGLSWNKVASIRDLAEKADQSAITLDPRTLGHMSDAEIASELISVRGIGRWSAEMFLMFQLRRLDVWPSADFGVRSGYAAIWSTEGPTAKELDALGEIFRPYRSVVAWYCWRALGQDGI